ncbi:hypothetical protein COSO111634_23380 [Corallococcus soli]
MPPTRATCGLTGSTCTLARSAPASTSTWVVALNPPNVAVSWAVPSVRAWTRPSSDTPNTEGLDDA